VTFFRCGGQIYNHSSQMFQDSTYLKSLESVRFLTESFKYKNAVTFETGCTCIKVSAISQQSSRGSQKCMQMKTAIFHMNGHLYTKCCVLHFSM